MSISDLDSDGTLLEDLLTPERPEVNEIDLFSDNPLPDPEEHDFKT